MKAPLVCAAAGCETVGVLTWELREEEVELCELQASHEIKHAAQPYERTYEELPEEELLAEDEPLEEELELLLVLDTELLVWLWLAEDGVTLAAAEDGWDGADAEETLAGVEDGDALLEDALLGGGTELGGAGEDDGETGSAGGVTPVSVGAGWSCALTKVNECDSRTTREKSVRMRAEQRMAGDEEKKKDDELVVNGDEDRRIWTKDNHQKCVTTWGMSHQDALARD